MPFISILAVHGGGCPGACVSPALPRSCGTPGGEGGERQRDRAVVLVTAGRCQAWPPGGLRQCQQDEQWLGHRGLRLCVTGGDAHPQSQPLLAGLCGRPWCWLTLS